MVGSRGRPKTGGLLVLPGYGVAVDRAWCQGIGLIDDEDVVEEIILRVRNPSKEHYSVTQKNCGVPRAFARNISLGKVRRNSVLSLTATSGVKNPGG